MRSALSNVIFLTRAVPGLTARHRTVMGAIGLKFLTINTFADILKRVEVVSQPRITPEGKAQADSKAQHTRRCEHFERPAIRLRRTIRGQTGL